MLHKKQGFCLKLFRSLRRNDSVKKQLCSSTKIKEYRQDYLSDCVIVSWVPKPVNPKLSRQMLEYRLSANYRRIVCPKPGKPLVWNVQDPFQKSADGKYKVS